MIAPSRALALPWLLALSTLAGCQSGPRRIPGSASGSYPEVIDPAPELSAWLDAHPNDVDAHMKRARIWGEKLAPTVLDVPDYTFVIEHAERDPARRAMLLEALTDRGDALTPSDRDRARADVQRAIDLGWPDRSAPPPAEGKDTVVKALHVLIRVTLSDPGASLQAKIDVTSLCFHKAESDGCFGCYETLCKLLDKWTNEVASEALKTGDLTEYRRRCTIEVNFRGTSNPRLDLAKRQNDELLRGAAADDAARWEHQHQQNLAAERDRQWYHAEEEKRRLAAEKHAQEYMTCSDCGGSGVKSYDAQYRDDTRYETNSAGMIIGEKKTGTQTKVRDGGTYACPTCGGQGEIHR